MRTKRPYIAQYLFKVNVTVIHRQGGKGTDGFYVVSSSLNREKALEEIERKVKRVYSGTSFTPVKIDIKNFGGSAYAYVLP